MRFREQHRAGDALRLELVEASPTTVRPASRLASRQSARSASARVNSGVSAGQPYHSPNRWIPSISRPPWRSRACVRGDLDCASNALFGCRVKCCALPPRRMRYSRLLAAVDVNVKLLHNSRAGAIISAFRTRYSPAQARTSAALRVSPNSAAVTPSTVTDDRLLRAPRFRSRRSPTPFVRWRWTRWRPPIPAIPACRWAWPTSPWRCGTGTLRTTRRIRTGPTATASCSPTATARCCCMRCCT